MQCSVTTTGHCYFRCRKYSAHFFWLKCFFFFKPPPSTIHVDPWYGELDYSSAVTCSFNFCPQLCYAGDLFEEGGHILLEQVRTRMMIPVLLYVVLVAGEYSKLRRGRSKGSPDDRWIFYS
jgi:hypothetical protein